MELNTIVYTDTLPVCDLCRQTCTSALEIVIGEDPEKGLHLQACAKPPKFCWDKLMKTAFEQHPDLEFVWMRFVRFRSKKGGRSGQ